MKRSKKSKIKQPVDDYFRNFIFTNDNHVWVGYKFFRKNMPMNELKFFEEHNENGEGVLSLDQYEYHFMNIPNKFNVHRQIDITKENYVQGKLKAVGDTYFDCAADIIAEETNASTYTTYLFVKLTNIPTPSTPSEYFKLFQRAFTHNLIDTLGLKEKTTLVVEELIEQEKELFETINLNERVYRTKEEDYEKTTYRMFHRADDEIPVGKIPTPAITEGIFKLESNYLRVKQNDKTHYLASINMVDTPSSLFGSSWIQKLQNSVSFTFETHIRSKFRNNEEDKKLSSKMRRRLFNQEKEISQDEEERRLFNEDEVLLFGQERIASLSKSLIEEEKRLTWSSIHFVLASDSIKGLDDLVERFFYAHKSSKFKLYFSHVDQIALFNQSLIGSPFNFHAFDQPVTTGFIADLGMYLERDLGNVMGYPLGRLVHSLNGIKSVDQAIQSSSKIVWLFLGLAKKHIEGASINNGNFVIYGSPGKGKSYLSKLIFLWSSFFGQKTLYFEPKNEMKLFVAAARAKFSHVKEFMAILDEIHFITIDKSEKNRGILDPLIFLKGEEAIDTAKEVLFQLGKLYLNPETIVKKETIIGQCIKEEVQQENKPCLASVIERITQVDLELGTSLREYNSGIAKVLIGEKDSQAISFAHMINVLGMQGAQPASKKVIEAKAETNEQRAASVIMQVVMKVTTVFSTDKEQDSMIIFDEMKTIEEHPQGEFMIEESLRKGRANNTDVGLITQAQVDIDTEENESLISYKFGFPSETESSHEKMLDYFEVEKNKANLELLKKMSAGMCLFQDHRKRNGIVAIDALFSEWHTMFLSTKQTSKQTQFALEMERID